MGSILWLYLDKEEFPKRPDQISAKSIERFKRIHRKVLSDGVYLPPSSFEVCFIGNAHTEIDIEKCAKTIVDHLMGNVREGVS